MKSNPYVYPYTPFQNLSNKNIRNNFLDKQTIGIEKLKELVGGLPVDKPIIKGETMAENILSIFQDGNYRFGPAEFIEQNKGNWMEKLNYFIKLSQPIQFSILGVPFKVPVPLKTNRILPDMGEVLLLLRLYTITNQIKQIYEPGAQITIFAEGIFAKFVDMPIENANNYKNFLDKLNSWCGFDKCLAIKNLSDMENTVDNFDIHFNQHKDEFKKLYDQKDYNFIKKYNGAYDSLYRIVTTVESDEDVLMDVYNDQFNENQLTDKVKEIRLSIQEKTHKALLQYFAYLKVRDDLNYIEKTIPSVITLTVSPKPNRLGIIPINKDCIRLPYHGVPVYYPDKNKFLIEYLIDIKRSSYFYTPIYFDLDTENKPFYYVING